MSETQPAAIGHNKTVLILMGVIVLLLVLIAGIVAFGGGSDVPAPTADAGTTVPATTDGSTGMPAGTAAPPADYDPTTATQVPADQSPEDFTAGYYEALLAGDWETAFYSQPAHKQAGTIDDFAGQIQGYGVVGYTVVSATDQGETYVVVVDQQTGQFGTFENTWVFVQYEGAWVVQDKAVTGMK
jgi:hypothetical protein